MRIRRYLQKITERFITRKLTSVLEIISLVGFLVLLLTGCTSDTRPQKSWSHITSNMNRVQKGMSMEQVGFLLGAPSSFYEGPTDYKGRKLGSISWSYENHSEPSHTYREFLVIFSDQVVSATQLNIDG